MVVTPPRKRGSVKSLRMIRSGNRFPPRIKSGAGFFGITRY
jgi:hypothetical protein